MSGPSRAEVIAKAVARLHGAGVPDPERDARHLYRWASGLDGAGLSAALSDPARPSEIARFERVIEARESRVPVSQIVGFREFWRHRFKVTRDVLDPRPETETLVAAALEGAPARRILDLGTGSGCILLSLLAEWPEATGVGVDCSAAALEVAAENASALGLADRAAWIAGNWFDHVTGLFDLIVSNPPYIAASEMQGLAPELRLHEPLEALTPGGDGLDAYRAILAQAQNFLDEAGQIYLEIGAGQEFAVAGLARANGFGPPVSFQDMDRRSRVLQVIPARN